MKQVTAQYDVEASQIGPFTIARALPNAAVQFVGPVMLLDHLPPRDIAPGKVPDPDGSFAHPHRGIVTFTYVLEGALTHADSSGGHGTITAGGVQWMKSGNGIVHDEMIPAALRKQGGRLHSFQFWINLPARNKAERAEYLAVQDRDLPVAPLPGMSASNPWGLPGWPQAPICLSLASFPVRAQSSAERKWRRNALSCWAAKERRSRSQTRAPNRLTSCCSAARRLKYPSQCADPS